MTPLGKQHNQAVLRDLHSQGIELTPDQLDEERKAAYATIRTKLLVKGYAVPDDDEGLLQMMRDVLKP